MNHKKKLTKLIVITLSTTCYLLLTSSFIPHPSSFAFAQEESGYDRINDIAKQLNCPTCAGINLADCRTKTCEQWREQISDKIDEGYTDQEILDFFAVRYGDQVLQEPPKRGFSLALWILPVIALLAGGAWLVYTMRGWSKQEPAPTTAAPTETRPSPPPSGTPDDDYLSQVEKDLGIE